MAIVFIHTEVKLELKQLEASERAALLTAQEKLKAEGLKLTYPHKVQ